MTDPFDLRPFVREIKDFPKPGIVFRDITPLLSHAGLFHETILAMFRRMPALGYPVTIAAPESRGFILGAALAQRAECGFIPMRKPGKLPFTTLKCDYGLEYRESDQLQMHADAIEHAGDEVLIVDDVLATGGTAVAACDLVRLGGGKVLGVLVLVDLVSLGGRKKIEDAGYRVETLLQY